ncbi:Protein kinase domain [Macleaya cordata]|uniref:non-specific serine/threonine protein kinase n=1 Tax=Macleaya cordata TaxID=56857 RepID=A0A200PR66_MACCD|nr:Protein kinase domain [Macleaya cordata]
MRSISSSTNSTISSSSSSLSSPVPVPVPVRVLPLKNNLEVIERRFGAPFNSSYYNIFSVEPPATISNGALQITPDSANNDFSLQHKSGRILFSQYPFHLWKEEEEEEEDHHQQGSDEGNHINTNSSTSQSSSKRSIRIVSFNVSFLINIFRFPNSTAPGEGFAFIIAPDLNTPSSSDGQYLGLTNATTDGNPDNHLIAVELDTVKQSFDPDDNHLGLDINSIRSTKTVSLSNYGIQIAPLVAKNYSIWIQYDGRKRVLRVYMAQQGEPFPAGKPLLRENLNIRDYVQQKSYFGFAGSTGNWTQLNCVLAWNLTVEKLDEDLVKKKKKKKKMGILYYCAIGGVATLLLVLGVVVVGLLCYYLWYKKKIRMRNGYYDDDPRILGALKSLPGTPREFRFKDLKKATNNFDEKLKLGQGGFGVVYKGVLPNENTQVAVKKFSRDNLKEGKDDFLAELTIINRLRHKHLVRLVGWCHKKGMLLLVYDYMPNGSLDKHLFFPRGGGGGGGGGGGDHPVAADHEEDKEKNNMKILRWDHRYKILSGVASALHYLHDEYDQKVIHRDLKASNVLLDSDYNARLGDFGLARALDNEKTSYAELEGIPGTLGYIAPECFHTGKATPESDVYSFGAIVLEVICGQRPWINCSNSTSSGAAGFQFLVDWVWTLHREGQILEAVDDNLGDDYAVEEAERLLLLGLACSHPIARERPKTQEIVQIMSGSIQTPYVPHFKPAFMWPSSSMMMTTMDEDSTTIMTDHDDDSNNMTADTTPMTSSYNGGDSAGWTTRSVAREGYTDSSAV